LEKQKKIVEKKFKYVYISNYNINQNLQIKSLSNTSKKNILFKKSRRNQEQNLLTSVFSRVLCSLFQLLNNIILLSFNCKNVYLIRKRL